MGRLIRVKVFSTAPSRRRRSATTSRDYQPTTPFRSSSGEEIPSVCERRMGGKYFKTKEQDEDEQEALRILQEWL